MTQSDLSADLLTDFIRTHPAFEALDSSGRSAVLTNAKVLFLKKGEILFERKTPSDNLYFLIKGRIFLESESGKHTQSLGAFLGGDALFSEQPYHKTATAQNNCTFIEIQASFIREFVKLHPALLPHFLSTENQGDHAKNTPKKQSISPREFIGYIATFLVPFAVYNIMGGTWVEPAITLFMCVLSATVTMWFFCLFPGYIPALFFLLSILALDLAPPEVILHGFATQTFIILLSTFTLGAAILVSGLAHRVMLIFFKRFSNSFFQSNLALFFSGVFLTPFMPAVVARAEIAAPMFLEATQALKFKKGSMATTQLSISIFFGMTLFSSVFLSGSLLNYMVLALMPEYMQVHFSWSVWLEAASIYGGVILIGYLMGMLYFLKGAKTVKITKKTLENQLKIMGPITANERLLVFAILLFIVGILTVSLHKIETAWVAFFVMFFILFFEVLKTKQFRHHIDWTFLIVIATTIGISSVLKFLHIDKFLFDSFVSMMDNYKMSSVEFLLFSAILTFFIRVVLPLGPAAIVAGTLTIPLALHYETHPWVVAFTVVVMTDVWFLKHQSPAYNLFKARTQVDSKLVYSDKGFMAFNRIMNFVKIAGFLGSIPMWKAMGLL